MAYLRVAFASDMGVALVIRSVLESEGIDVQDVSNSGHVSLAGADQGFYISVREEQAEDAVTRLKEHELDNHLLQ